MFERRPLVTRESRRATMRARPPRARHLGTVGELCRVPTFANDLEYPQRTVPGGQVIHPFLSMNPLSRPLWMNSRTTVWGVRRARPRVGRTGPGRDPSCCQWRVAGASTLLLEPHFRRHSEGGIETRATSPIVAGSSDCTIHLHVQRIPGLAGCDRPLPNRYFALFPEIHSGRNLIYTTH